MCLAELHIGRNFFCLSFDQSCTFLAMLHVREMPSVREKTGAFTEL